MGLAGVVLVAGVALVIGFAVGVRFEEANLERRERRLAAERRVLRQAVNAVAAVEELNRMLVRAQARLRRDAVRDHDLLAVVEELNPNGDTASDPAGGPTDGPTGGPAGGPTGDAAHVRFLRRPRRAA